MARKNREERRAARAETKAIKKSIKGTVDGGSKKEDRQAAKKKQKEDLVKIDAANKAVKESAKAKKEEKRRVRKNGIDKGPAVFNKQKEQPRGVTHVDASNPPPGSDPVVTKYPSLADYTKANPPENAKATISGGDPKTETVANVVEKSTSYGEMKNAEVLGKAVKDDVDAVEKQTKKSELILDAATKERAEDGTRNTEAGYTPYDGDGSSIGGVARGGSGQYSLDEEEFARASEDHKRQNAAAKASAPLLAIEKMGIEHYYPPQKDFITSNFSGRYIGSRQIVAATGGLYPEGLLDARKRALRDKSAAKAEAESKYWELTNTAPQYDEEYKDIGMDILSKYYEASGGDIQGLLSGDSKLAREFQRDMYDYKSRGKNIESVNSMVNDLVEKLNTGDEYIPPEVIKNMYDVRTAQADLGAYMRGEGIGDEQMKKLSNSLRSYQNFTPLAIQELEMLDKLGANELPFAAGTDFNDPTFAANAMSAIERTKHRDYDEYLTTMSKFFDVGAIEEIVDGIYRNNNLYEGTTPEEYQEHLRSGARYMMAHLPEKINIEQKFQNNKALGWESLAHKDSVWNTKKQWRTEDIESMYSGINNDMNKPEFQAAMVKAHGSSNDPKVRADAMNQVWQQFKYTPNEAGGYSSANLPTLGETVQSVTPKNDDVIGRDGNQRSIKNEIGTRWVDYHKLKKAGKQKEADLVMADIKELKHVQASGVPMNMQVGSRTVTMGYWNPATGITTPLENYNGKIDPKYLVNTVHLGGQLDIETGTVNDGKNVTEPSTYTYVDNHSIESRATRMILGAQESKAEGVGFTKEYWEQQAASGYSESTGSSTTTP